MDELKGLYVSVKENNFDYALKKFKRMVKDSNLMIELQESMYYIKPSEKRRNKKNQAIARNKAKTKKEKIKYS